MGLQYLLDEHLRGPLRRAVVWHNNRGVYPLDAVRVGDLVDLPLGSLDPDILIWAEHAQRLVVTRDPDTMPTHLAEHLRAGRHSPGVFMIRRNSTLPAIVTFLVDAAYASDPADWQDKLQFIP